jgi:hypothetical protein
MLNVKPNQLQIMADQSVLSKYIISRRFRQIEKKNLCGHTSCIRTMSKARLKE